eukprot:11524874-Alexandrium_andersonii.AAC.1
MRDPHKKLQEVPRWRAKKTDRYPYGNVMKVAALNVRSLLKPTMHRQITDYMKSHDLHIMALQETKNPTTTQYVSEGYMFLLFGNEESREHAGV